MVHCVLPVAKALLGGRATHGADASVGCYSYTHVTLARQPRSPRALNGTQLRGLAVALFFGALVWADAPRGTDPEEWELLGLAYPNLQTEIQARGYATQLPRRVQQGSHLWMVVIMWLTVPGPCLLYIIREVRK